MRGFGIEPLAGEDEGAGGVGGLYGGIAPPIAIAIGR